MKLSLLYAIFILGAVTAQAQKTNSFAIGIDYVNYMNPKEWHNDHVTIAPTSLKNFFGDKTALWLSYFYRDRYSIRLYQNFYEKSAKYNPAMQMPDNFLYLRQFAFYDLTVGYNLLRHIPKCSGYIYAGAGYMPYLSDDRMNYAPDGWDEMSSGRYAKHKVCPAMQVLFKYNPVRNVFVEFGGTCHYVFKDFLPVSLNVGVGFQI